MASRQSTATWAWLNRIAFSDRVHVYLRSSVIGLAAALTLGNHPIYGQESGTTTATPPQAEAASSDKPATKAKSVSPGINAGFLDPDLKVEEWIAKFEVESREIYECRQQVLKAMEIKPGTAIADVGAGTGLFMSPFAEAVGKNGRVYEVDISPRFVNHLRNRAKERQLPQVEVVLCSEKSTELSPNSVDLVFVCDTYHHFEFPQATLSSINKALKPGGRLILIDFNRIPGESRDWTMTHVRAGKDEFRKEVEDAGFHFIDEVAIDGFQENYMLRFSK